MIDWDRVAALREEIGPEDFDDVVEIFLDEVDEEVATLTSLSNGQELGEKLHFLKGSALNLGFEAFSGLCHAGESSLAQAPDAVVDLEKIMASYRTSRATFLDDLPHRFSGQTSL